MGKPVTVDSDDLDTIMTQFLDHHKPVTLQGAFVLAAEKGWADRKDDGGWILSAAKCAAIRRWWFSLRDLSAEQREVRHAKELAMIEGWR